MHLEKVGMLRMDDQRARKQRTWFYPFWMGSLRMRFFVAE